MRHGRIYRLFAGGALLALASGHAQAQTPVDLKTQTKSVDFSVASSTKTFQAGTVLPATCLANQTFFKTNAPPGANFYGCTSANTWTLEIGGTAAPSLQGNNAWLGNNDFTNAASVSLPFPWVTMNLPHVYTPGAKQTFQPSATTAGVRLVGSSTPSSPVGGDLNITLSGAFEWFDGTFWNIAAPLTSPSFTTPSLGVANATRTGKSRRGQTRETGCRSAAPAWALSTMGMRTISLPSRMAPTACHKFMPPAMRPEASMQVEMQTRIAAQCEA